jgi:hypothetical protein
MDLALILFYACFNMFLHISNGFMRVVPCAGSGKAAGHNGPKIHLVPKNVVFKLFSDIKQEKMAELPFSSLKGMRGGRFKLFFRPL